MPTVHRMMYFHAASTASGRLWNPRPMRRADTMVVASIPIHMTARLFAMHTSSIVKTKRWNRP